jgi:alpha-L-glutamate ligase-like protein
MSWLSSYASPFALAKKGILGMNERNIAYISRYNPRKLYPLVDDKLQTKAIAMESGVTVPGLIGVIKQQHQIRYLGEMLAEHSGFCIKPAQGSGGKGILVITGKQEDTYLKSSGTKVEIPQIERHVSNILAGLFSLGGKNDVAVIEHLVHFDPVFADFSFEGVPDTRVIVFKGFPIMAMMRLPTARSEGKANLHQGAVGVGIDLCTGCALKAVQFDRAISHHPDTGKPLAQLHIPQWDRLLNLAASCYEMSGLGYLGTDMVLDRHQGPMLLELNARPGLSIQVANSIGLLPRLRQIEDLGKKAPRSPEQRIAYIKEHFCITPRPSL